MNRSTRIVVLIVGFNVCLFLPLSFFAHAFSISNFETPESVAIDSESSSYFVSNINGSASEKDGNGYISRIPFDGNIVIQKFIGGKDDVLNAPKGLVVAGKSLFVTDIDVVKGFDKMTGKPVAAIDLKPYGAKFLNDVTVDLWGALYVSDTMADRIFKIDTARNYEVAVFKEGPVLGHPNGILFNRRNRSLMVAAWESGEIYEIDSSGRIHVLKRGLKGLDGIDLDAQGNLYVSSFEKGEVYRIGFYGRGSLSVHLSGLITPADIVFDQKKNELVVPSFRGNTVSTYPRK